jgi:hypothetical protein
VEGDVVLKEGGNEVVAVVVALLHTYINTVVHTEQRCFAAVQTGSDNN